MTQQEQAKAIYTEYLNTPKRNILDVYGRPSSDKIKIEGSIYFEMWHANGADYKVMSFNGFRFTCAYIIKEKNQLIYYTQKYKRIIDLNNFKVISKTENEILK